MAHTCVRSDIYMGVRFDANALALFDAEPVVLETGGVAAEVSVVTRASLVQRVRGESPRNREGVTARGHEPAPESRVRRSTLRFLLRNDEPRQSPAYLIVQTTKSAASRAFADLRQAVSFLPIGPIVRPFPTCNRPPLGLRKPLFMNTLSRFSWPRREAGRGLRRPLPEPSAR